MSEISQHNIHNNQLQNMPIKPGYFILLKNRVSDILQLWITRHQQRTQLAKLSEHMLKDIGLSASQVSKEINKPFWK